MAGWAAWRGTMLGRHANACECHETYVTMVAWREFRAGRRGAAGEARGRDDEGRRPAPAFES